MFSRASSSTVVKIPRESLCCCSTATSVHLRTCTHTLTWGKQVLFGGVLLQESVRETEKASDEGAVMANSFLFARPMSVNKPNTEVSIQVYSRGRSNTLKLWGHQTGRNQQTSSHLYKSTVTPQLQNRLHTIYWSEKSVFTSVRVKVDSVLHTLLVSDVLASWINFKLGLMCLFTLDKCSLQGNVHLYKSVRMGEVVEMKMYKMRWREKRRALKLRAADTRSFLMTSWSRFYFLRGSCSCLFWAEHFRF